MRILPLLPTMCAVFALLPPALAVVNPHQEGRQDRCLRCHVRVPSAEDVAAGEYRLLKGSIDEVCLICHTGEECCRVGEAHHEKSLSLGHSHASGVDLEDVAKVHHPRSLPVHDGKITCYTCHFHSRQPTNDYKLVRLVVVKDTGVDWTALCRDCHADY